MKHPLLATIPRRTIYGAQVVRCRAAALGRQFIDLLFPPRCLLCEVEEPTVQSAVLLCDTCRAELLQSAGSYCPRCGAAGGGAAAEGATEAQPNSSCVECRNRRFQFDRVVRLGSYDGALREAVLRMKHPRDEPLARAVAELFWDRCASEWSTLEVDCVVPVPLHWWRWLRRGTSSPQTIAACLGRRLGVPVIDDSLVRVRDTQPQGGLAAIRRRQNVRGAFELRGDKNWIRARRVLVVDDVLTSGATADEMSRVLKRAGAAWVAVATIARTPDPRLIGAAR
ncbi:MAG: ComF family protein [Pirellulales bacterium]